MKKRMHFFACIAMFFAFNCNAMEHKVNQPEKNSEIITKQDSLTRRLIYPLIVGLLALSGQAAEATNSSLPTCSAHQIMPVRQELPLAMATIYFNGTACESRCIATADLLGPIYAKCIDDEGCDNMFLSGALSCEVDPAFVSQFGCSIDKEVSIPRFKKPKRSKRRSAHRRRKG